MCVLCILYYTILLTWTMQQRSNNNNNNIKPEELEPLKLFIPQLQYISIRIKKKWYADGESAYTSVWGGGSYGSSLSGRVGVFGYAFPVFCALAAFELLNYSCAAVIVVMALRLFAGFFLAPEIGRSWWAILTDICMYIIYMYYMYTTARVL